MASTATAVLPVWRSPMISSRCPRPMGTIASMALSPVCSGSRTGCRSTTPGAIRSIGMKVFVAIGPFPSIGWPKRIDDPAQQLLANGHRDDSAGALDDVAFLDLGVLAQQHRADAVLFEVQRDAEDPVRKLEHLARHGPLDAVNAGDAVAERDDAAHFGDVDLDRVAANLLADDLGNFFSFDVHLLIRILCRQSLSNLLQLGCDAGVVDGAADARDEAADDVLVHLRRHGDALARDRRRASSRWRRASRATTAPRWSPRRARRSAVRRACRDRRRQCREAARRDRDRRAG